MLGLLLIYFVGKYFYELAHEHDRSRWGFAIFGVVVYYASQFVFGLILGILLLASGTEFTSGMEIGANLFGIVLGVGSVWLFYFLLKRAWEKNPKKVASKSDLLDDM